MPYKSIKVSSALVLPRRMRKKLRSSYGITINSQELPAKLSASDTIYSIGDVTTANLLRAGYIPKIAVFDYSTERKRKVLRIINKNYPNPIKVKNASGEISVELWNALRSALRSGKRVGIRVYGEEDLAALPIIHMCRNGSFVIYGLRGIGMDLIKANSKVKAKIYGILSEMQRYSTKREKDIKRKR